MFRMYTQPMKPFQIESMSGADPDILIGGRGSTAFQENLTLSVRLSVCLSGSRTFLVVTHSYVSQATHAFLGMLPLRLYFKNVQYQWKINNKAFKFRLWCTTLLRPSVADFSHF